MFRLEELAGELRGVVADLDPAVYDGRDAARLTKTAAEIEKLGASAKLLGRLCQPHHDLVTHRGYTIAIHDDGTWTLHPPDAEQERDAHAA